MIEALFVLVSFLKSGLKNRTELALENSLATEIEVETISKGEDHENRQ